VHEVEMSVRVSPWSYKCIDMEDSPKHRRTKFFALLFLLFDKIRWVLLVVEVRN